MTHLCRLWLQTNLYCTESGSKLIFTAQTQAPNKSLQRRIWLQTNLYCADSGSKLISTAQNLSPNKSLLRRLGLQWISTTQTRTPNEYLLRRLGLQTKLYCTDSGSKQISTAQIRAPNKSLLHRLGLQTNLYCTDSGSKQIVSGYVCNHVPWVGNETLRPLGVAMGNAFSVTRVWRYICKNTTCWPATAHDVTAGTTTI